MKCEETDLIKLLYKVKVILKLGKIRFGPFSRISLY